MRVESKIEAFEKIAIADANEKKRQAAAEMESRFASMVDESVREETRKSQDIIRTERYKVDRSKNKRIVDESSYAKREFIAHREKLTADLFDGVLSDLRTFTVSPDYEKLLPERISIAARDGKFEAVQLTAADMRLAEKVTEACGLPAEEAPDDFIGGFRLIGSGRRSVSDHTFSGALNAQRAEFSLLVSRQSK